MNKKLYPMKFIPIPSKRVWGGNSLIKVLGKDFVEIDEEGNEVKLTTNDLIGESWELSDMLEENSVVSEGWLAGNTIEDVMETYMESVVGEKVYNYYGRQFPLLIKFLDIHQKLSVQVHPDDEIAAQRYDSLGKAEIWYVIDAKPDAKVYMGFRKPTTAQEFYDACKAGTAHELLNVIHPKPGDSIYVAPGTVHAAEGGIMIAEVQESSDMTFRLYDWGRENNPATARRMHLEEAIDLINYNAFDSSLYRQSCTEEKSIEKLVETEQFTVNKLKLTDKLHIYSEKFNSYIVYICVEGEAAISLESGDTYSLKKGETILVPAELPDFYLYPVSGNAVVLEAFDGVREEEEFFEENEEEQEENVEEI